MATTLERLRAVSRAIPALDQAAAARAAEAQQTQVNQAVQQAPAGSGVRAAQAIAPQATLAVAQPGLAAREAGIAAQTQLGQQALAAAGTQAQKTAELTAMDQSARLAADARGAKAELSAAERAQRKTFTAAELQQAQRLQRAGIAMDARLGFLSNKQREDLARLGRDVKSELADSRLQLEKDEKGWAFTKDRQLWDYTVAAAKSDEALKDRMQLMSQTYDRKAKLLDIAFGKIDAELVRQYEKAAQEGDQASAQRIADYRSKLAKEQERQRHDAAQKGMMMGVLSTAVVAGATAYGGPAAGVVASSAAGAAASEGPSAGPGQGKNKTVNEQPAT